MIEPEMAFADLEDDMNVAEAMLKYVIRYVMEHAPEEMNFFNQFIDKGLKERLEGVLNAEFCPHHLYRSHFPFGKNTMMRLNIKFPGDVIFRQNMSGI